MLAILMKMPSTTPDENSLRDKRLYFRGRAKVPLDHLRYHGTSAHREIDQKHVTHLINVFKTEGCARLHNPNHYVPVLVSNEDLSAALAQSGLRRLDLMQDGEPHYLRFPANANVTVLHGEHRLRAAERYLDPADCWWVAVLYITGI